MTRTGSEEAGQFVAQHFLKALPSHANAKMNMVRHNHILEESYLGMKCDEMLNSSVSPFPQFRKEPDKSMLPFAMRRQHRQEGWRGGGGSL